MRAVLVFLLLVAVAAAAFVYSGVYPIGADQPHWPLTERTVGVLRDRSIAKQAAGIDVPALDDPARIRRGAEHYAEMCTACHLTPGMRDTELRKGLYPQPPDLARGGIGDPAQAFWAIKHGIKMSGMPATGSRSSRQSSPRPATNCRTACKTPRRETPAGRSTRRPMPSGRRSAAERETPH